MKRFVPLLSALLLSFTLPPVSHAAEARWWKGNLHTHSLWSDGDDYPDMIAHRYKERGYHFLMLSDHNVIAGGERWSEVAKNKGKQPAYDNYLKHYGPDWVESRTVDGKLQVRLKTLEEYRTRVEEPDRFLIIKGEEISARHVEAGRKNVPIHVNATNLREVIIPQSGNTVLEVLTKNVDAVMAQREATGQLMFPHLNHPNFFYAVTAEELLQVKNERFFEVYNGHPSVHNEGDNQHASTERIWDIVLTRRLAELGTGPVYGLAVDDAHSYHRADSKLSNPFRGWVQVRAQTLAPEALIRALEAGDFYSSSGVVLKDVQHRGKQLRIRIQPEPGVTYTTRFIGTRKGYDPRHEPVKDKDGKPIRTTHRYSDDIGALLAEVQGPEPAYTLKGDEIYVRAVIQSTKPMENPYREGETQQAWVQPWVQE